MTVPSSGDVLTTSQVAWRIGRAFAAGRKDAPAEFRDIETEVTGLAQVLKQLAEALHPSTAWEAVGEDVQDGIGTIFVSCKRTVDDLDTLIEQYQAIKKHRTVGGFAIERTWSDLVSKEYKTMIWTSEGGNLQCLRESLRAHSISITILLQTLRSEPAASLQTFVNPIAHRTHSIHQVHGRMDEQLEELHDILRGLTTSSPNPDLVTPPLPARNPARSPVLDGTTGPSPISMPSSPSLAQRQRPNTQTFMSSPRESDHSPPPSSPPGLQISNSTYPSPSIPTVSGASSPDVKRVSEFSFGVSSLRFSSSSCASSTASSAGWSNPRDSFTSRNPTVSPVSRLNGIREQSKRRSEDALSLLPPPVLGYTTNPEPERVTSRPSLSPYPATQPDVVKLHRSSTTSSQKASFEKEAFRNSAILCDVRGTLAEYSHQINEDDPRDVEMIRACDECRIAVVRKRVHHPETKRVRVVTSIWTFSDDNTIRMELRMDDNQMYIPYSSYFSPNKVSITVPCELKLHDVKHGNRLAKLAKTSWVNYVFDTPHAATLFQNELMGRTLLATFRTEKTMRVHEGISKSFSYAEQMCGLENLRIWEDNDTGAIIALIHFSADFRAGYLAFYLNSTANPIKVKDDGNREVKIKGLKVPIDRGDKAMRKDSVVDKGKGRDDAKKVDKEKVISGARIEFASDMEKSEFLAMVQEVQKELVELPDLLGVN
ncbi:hypothetical protein EK21DRAFT_101798 [Setomelanomma holmii]|uniref:Uncharacterized protein n=1 Tax=Setomelanomma holmii TaxID=210430 RepID=A0A9P4H5C2_9PLEO|nr:hypothetical protein EK21DRAFT_101798 [Setomelanomma holmii]